MNARKGDANSIAAIKEASVGRSEMCSKEYISSIKSRKGLLYLVKYS